LKQTGCAFAAFAVVIGVTSWGYFTVDGEIAGLEGASFFGNNKEFPDNYPRGNGNIGALMNFGEGLCTAASCKVYRPGQAANMQCFGVAAAMPVMSLLSGLSADPDGFLAS
jgi:hypothetical protein